MRTYTDRKVKRDGQIYALLQGKKERVRVMYVPQKREAERGRGYAGISGYGLGGDRRRLLPE
jgi:hypothetical protein